jgi:pimeloyl-ACP methyl ester carboxylesterase
MPLTTRANGLEFSYIEEGSGPLVLLLHGFPDTPQTWDRTRPVLAAAGFRAVSPFLRGYAPTEVPKDGDYRVETLARDAGELIAALGEKGAIVVGHDWGAAAAYGAANLFPERVRFLVTVAIPHAASVRPSLRLLWAGRHFLALRRRGAAARVRADDFAYVDTLVQRWSPAWRVPPDETRAVKAVFAVPGSLEAAIGYYRAVGLTPPASQLEKIRMPALAFAGSTDGVFNTAAFERARPHYLAAYDVVTLPGGHFLHREHPEEFNAALVKRLAAVRG